MLISILFSFCILCIIFISSADEKNIRETIDSPKNTIIFSDDMNGINDTNSLKSRGYKVYYRGSGPQGTSAVWFQGQPSKFPAYNGPQNGYIASDFNVVTGQNNIDCWLVLPRISGGILTNDSIFLYSRSEQSNPYADSIRVMYSTNDSIPEGVWSEIGRFKTSTSGFWEKRGFKATDTSISGRFAIRYCVANGGPSGQNSNYIGIDAISIIRGNLPSIIYTPLGNCPRGYWPPKVFCQVNDNYGVDSVWVDWRKNNGPYNRFNLTHDSVNKWSNTFNSTVFQVVVGDSIFYRIIARNISRYEDSTLQFKFCILAEPICCIGTGNISIGWLLPLMFTDSRTDILYTAQDIIAAGGSAGNIVAIAFNIVDVDTLSINSFNVKCQLFPDTNLTGFIYGGWSTCYSGTYAFQGTGWQTINLTTPFYWDGINSLLIEICYHNKVQSYASSVMASISPPTRMISYNANLSSGSGCTAPWQCYLLTNRCNICLSIIPPVLWTGNNPGIIPDKYSLFQNYPNPFNPVTKIKYDLPDKGFVSLIVYDIIGREISQLIKGVKSPGNYIIDFDGSNLSSGMYFYKLTISEPSGKMIKYTSVKKMLLIK
jgi:hypothetical protein